MVKNSDKHPFLFLFTGDEFLRRSKIDSLLNQLVPPSLRLTNLFRLFGHDIDFSSALNQAGTPSLLGGVQVFWISQAEEIKKGDWASFENYCKQPVDQAYFVFEADELSQTHSLVKLAKAHGKWVELKNESSQSGMDLMKLKLKKAEKNLTPDAWEVLEERLGGSLKLMDQALEQLMLYSDSTEIDEAQVRDLTKEFLNYDPFDLTDALVQGNISAALKIFHYFYELSGDMSHITGLIHWQLKRIWQAKKMMLCGTRQDEIARTLRIPPFRIGQFTKQVERFNLARVEELLRMLWQFDWDSKKGAMEETTAMEVFLSHVGK